MRTSLIVLVLALAGCPNSVDSLVVVDVSADAPLSGVATFAVSATVGGKSASFRVTPPGGASTFDINPAAQSFGIDIPKGITGPLHVHVDALGADDAPLAAGDADTTIEAGVRVDLPLMLTVAGAAMGSDDMGPGGDMAPPPGAPLLAIDRTTQGFGNVTVAQASQMVAIAITNNGGQPTSALTFTPSGAEVDQFSLNSDCGAVLMPNQKCHVNAAFSPTSTGDKHAHFDVTAAMGGTVGTDLSGTGTPPGTVSITAAAPANGDCGATLLGTTSGTTATYTVKNIGTSPTGMPSVSTSDSTQFVASGCSVASLQPNDTCTVSVHFSAKQHGQQTASVSVSASPGGTANATASGFGQNPATFNVTSTSGFDFGSAAVGSGGATLTFTATNQGDVSSPSLTASTLTGAAAGSFAVVSDGCSGTSVAAGGHCTVSVRFSPTAQGPLSAIFNIRSASATLGMASLSGTGTAPGTVSITADTPISGDCGAALIGGTSATVATYTVKNIGTSATGMPSISTSDSAQFVASGCAVAALQPNDSCTVSVQFKPKQHGQQTASVSVTASPGGTASASATGFGQNAASFTITAAAGFDFGTTARGSTGTTLSFTATNQGDVASPSLAATSKSGGFASSFAITSDGCGGQAVAAGASCNLSVQFTPQVSGAPTAQINVRTASATLGTATVSGKATPIWTRETPSFALKQLSVVWGTDSSHVYIAGAGGTVLARSGGSWVDQSLTNGPDFGQAGATGTTSLWSSTTYGIERSTSPGVWFRDTGTGGPENVAVTGLAAVSPTSVWASWSYDNGTVSAPQPGSIIYHSLNGTWTNETLTLGSASSLWGTSDTDVYAWGTHFQNDGGSSYRVTEILHRDASQKWTSVFRGKTLGITANGSVGFTGIFGFGSPANNLYATARGDQVYHATSPTSWVAMADTPQEVVGPKLHCDAVWGASAANVYIACMSSIYMHDGTIWSKPLTDANINSFSSIWGSGANDVYAVGNDASGNGIIYHLY